VGQERSVSQRKIVSFHAFTVEGRNPEQLGETALTRLLINWS
jgi:hypothetical protein